MGRFYVCTSIPYVNADPHIGHAMELLTADVIARHARLKGDEVIFATGTDEHGAKIAEKAAEQNITPKQLTDQFSSRFKELAQLIDATNNRFIRTTDANHEKRAQIIWQKLQDDIYKSNYSGWYCVGDEAFFSEAEVKANNGICPNHNRPYEKIEEENYFFKLSKYQDQIANAIESDDFKIIPATRKHEILSVIKAGLDDISISRPKDKITWGIAIPGDDKQVMYVWFEALMNYITVLGYPDQEDFKNFWPANVQVIGKDIIRFHAAIWPAMLMSLGLALPKQLYVHGFITVEGQKMSKSIGNVVHPKEVTDKYGSDTFRYYFLRHIPSYDDGDFSWERLNNAYNNELANELGNALQRTISLVVKNFDGQLDMIEAKDLDIKLLDKLIGDCQFDRALDYIWEQIRSLNQYIDDKKPWLLAKDNNKAELKVVLSEQIARLYGIANALLPFIPKSAEIMIKQLTIRPLSLGSSTLFPKDESQ